MMWKACTGGHGQVIPRDAWNAFLAAPVLRQMSHEKDQLRIRHPYMYTGWFTGILVVAYYNP